MIPNIALTGAQAFPITDSSNWQSHRLLARGYRTKKPKLPNGAFDLSTAVALNHPPTLFPWTPFSSKTILLYTNIAISILDLDRPLPTINDTNFVAQSPPLVSLEPAQYDKHQLILSTGPQPIWVDVIVNNRDVSGHPFHLHGHDFYVIQSCSKVSYKPYNPYQPGSYPPRCGEYALEMPVRKDTVYIPPLGYVVLRWRADNEGIWMFHCHLLWHHSGGMAMGFRVLGQDNWETALNVTKV